VLHRHVDGYAGKEFFQRVSRQVPSWIQIATEGTLKRDYEDDSRRGRSKGRAIALFGASCQRTGENRRPSQGPGGNARLARAEGRIGVRRVDRIGIRGAEGNVACENLSFISPTFSPGLTHSRSASVAGLFVMMERLQERLELPGLRWTRPSEKEIEAC